MLLWYSTRSEKSGNVGLRRFFKLFCVGCYCGTARAVRRVGMLELADFSNFSVSVFTVVRRCEKSGNDFSKFSVSDATVVRRDENLGRMQKKNQSAKKKGGERQSSLPPTYISM